MRHTQIRQNDFEAIRTLVFHLPTNQRLQLYSELRKKDWKAQFQKARLAISKKFKEAGLTAKDVPAMIQEVRQEANQ